jgi:3-isopropylmalate dehydratase small subunit
VAGKAWKFGDDVDTDAIIPGRFLANWNKAPEKLKEHCFADMSPTFASQVQAGDFVVGGRNFGCGSSREAAPVAIKMAGVKVVIAQSFARIFYRNAINVGLLALESPADSAGISTGDLLEVDTVAGTIRNLTRQQAYNFKPIPSFLQQILDLGGLAPYVTHRLTAAKFTERDFGPAAANSLLRNGPKTVK